MMLLQIIWHFTRGMFERMTLVKVALLITLFYCFPKDQSIYAQRASTKIKADFYAEISSERDSLVVGDSCLVSVILYANLPFESVEQKPRNIVFPKDVHVTPIQTDRTQQQVRTARGVYYALVWQHYRVSRKDVGQIVCPEHQFTAELGLYQAVDDGFLDFFSFAPSMHLVEKRKAICKTPKYSLPVVERPKRNTQEILRSGRQVM